MTVRPEVWRHPEEATHEELIEMVTKLHGRNDRLKKKAALSNQRAEELEQKRHYVMVRLNRVAQYLALFKEQRAEGWLNRAAEELTRAMEEKSLW